MAHSSTEKLQPVSQIGTEPEYAILLGACHDLHGSSRPDLLATGTCPTRCRVFGLNGGEWFIVTFVTVMVVSARYWPALGARIGGRLGGRLEGPSPSEPPSNQ